MTTNTVDAIYIRHQRSLMAVNHADDVVLFSLRLALEELAASTPSMPSTNGHDQSQAERDRDALAAEIHDLRSQLAQLDADNAALIRRNEDLADELKRARLDAALTAFERDPDAILFKPVEKAAAANPPYVLPTIASATILNTDHPNGTTITVTPAPAAKASMWDDPASLTTLPADILDYWDGIAAGRWTWRRLPKPVRLAMVRHVLSFGPEDGAMTMAEFDAVRPEWMTAAASLPTTFGCSWSELNDLRTEIEVRS